MITFRQLLEQHYLADGLFTKKRAFAKIYIESGVSVGSLTNAFNGTRVDADNVDRLVRWASRTHPDVTLDKVQMLMAPTRRKAC